MGQQTLSGDDLSQLRAEYRKKVTEELPKRAENSEGWPIHHDHCFARVVLDNLFGDEWYRHVDDRPAYKQLSHRELQAAIAIAERLLAEGTPLVTALHQNSLRWRHKQG